MTISDIPETEEFENCFVNNADLDHVSGYINRFNPIRVMRMENMEIRHSAILAWLLDPLETHGFDDKFLRAFLSQALRGQDAAYEPTALDVSQADLRDAEIRREKKNIDLFVASSTNGWAFIIENKFHSKQHSGQLKRYLEKAKEEAEEAGLEFRHRGIFLTLHEEEPADEAKDGYVNLRYEEICVILDALLNGGAKNIGPEVRQFLNHYLEIIKDAAGMNEEQKKMEALAKQLYLTHKKVLDFVVEHGKSTDFTFACEAVFGDAPDVLSEVSISKGKYVFGGLNNRNVWFLPLSWYSALGENSYKWRGCESYWSKYPLIVWLEIISDENGKSGRIKLTAEVGSLVEHEFRKGLIESIQAKAKEKGLY